VQLKRVRLGQLNFFEQSPGLAKERPRFGLLLQRLHREGAVLERISISSWGA
jgi:hypothetical protein